MDLHTKQILHDFWYKPQEWHIHYKEMASAICTVMGLARQGDTVHLNVDNQVFYFYLTKLGGRVPDFNGLLRPFVRWLKETNIQLKVEWVPTDQMLADQVSRWDVDPSDYALSDALFHASYLTFIHFCQ